MDGVEIKAWSWPGACLHSDYQGKQGPSLVALRSFPSQGRGALRASSFPHSSARLSARAFHSACAGALRTGSPLARRQSGRGPAVGADTGGLAQLLTAPLGDVTTLQRGTLPRVQPFWHRAQNFHPFNSLLKKGFMRIGVVPV